MIHFPDKTLIRHMYIEDEHGVYGETIGSYQKKDTITVDFQNESNNEIAHAYGVELSDLYKIYIDINTPLNESDLLEDNKGNTYKIIGGIQEYSKFHKYKKAHLILTRRGKQ